MFEWFIIAFGILGPNIGLFASASCPSGWLTHESTCYFFSHTYERWSDAESICRGFSSKLAEPRTISSANFISIESTNLGGWFWLGMSDIITEGRWVYSSDQSPVTLTHWGPGQQHDGPNINCLSTWPNQQSKWSDEPCDRKNKFVCEMPEDGGLEVLG